MSDKCPEACFTEICRPLSDINDRFPQRVFRQLTLVAQLHLPESKPAVGVPQALGRLDGEEGFPMEPCNLFQGLRDFLNAFSQCIENSNRPG
jgi:hypothetical protein